MRRSTAWSSSAANCWAPPCLTPRSTTYGWNVATAATSTCRAAACGRSASRSATEAALNDCRLDGVAFEGCTLRSTEFSHTPLRGIDLRQSQLGDLRLTVDDLRGAIVAPSQALDLLPLLGVVVRTQTAEETE